MQFNLVVSSNIDGIGCWQRNGIHVVGTLPGGVPAQTVGLHQCLCDDQGTSGLEVRVTTRKTPAIALI